MLRPVPMVHLRIQAPAADAARATRRIAAAGLLHLVDLAHGRVPGDKAPAGTRELLAAFRELAHRVTLLADRLGVGGGEPTGEVRGESDLAREKEVLEARLAPLEARLLEAWRRGAAAHERAARCRDGLDRSRRLTSAGVDVERVGRLAFSELRFGLAAPEALSSLAALLSPAPYAVIPVEQEGSLVLAAVAVPVSGRQSLHAALRNVAFESVSLPARAEDWDPEALESALAAALAEEKEVEAEIATQRTTASAEIVQLKRRAETGVLLLQAQTNFAAAGRFVVISGWLPEAAAPRLKADVLAATEGRALVEIEKPEDLPEVSAGVLKVPILHRNPILLRPFQKLIELYGTPSYAEVEPTAFFAVSFLLMFGLMFGDVGHGAVLAAAGYCLFRYLPHYLDYAILLMEAGASSFVFGFLYGSLFGIETVLPALWIRPLHDLSLFLGVAALLGIVLISLGLLLNVRNAWRAGERAAALFSTRGLLGAFLYWVLVCLAARAILPATVRIPSAAIYALLGAAGALLLAKAPITRLLQRAGHGPPRRRVNGGPRVLAALEGVVELVDTLVAYFANTVSFLRVAAFGMVHAGAFIALFALIDTLQGSTLSGPLSVLALVAGNALIILLEGLTVSVQVLRLEYYEFFGKFFRGGGEPYRPLMLAGTARKGNGR